MAFLQALWWSSPGSRAAELEEEEDTCVPSPGGIPGPPEQRTLPQGLGLGHEVERRLARRGEPPKRGGRPRAQGGRGKSPIPGQGTSQAHCHPQNGPTIPPRPKPGSAGANGELERARSGELGCGGVCEARPRASGHRIGRPHQARAELAVLPHLRRNSGLGAAHRGSPGAQSPKAADRVHARGHPPQAPGEWERAAGTRLRGGTRCCPQAGLGQVTRWRRVLTEE